MQSRAIAVFSLVLCFGVASLAGFSWGQDRPRPADNAAASDRDDTEADAPGQHDSIDGDGILSYDCPGDSSDVITGTTGDDVLIYGLIQYGASPPLTTVGYGACRFTVDTGETCYRGTAVTHYVWSSPPSYPLGIYGDPSGGAYGEDFIAPASRCGGGSIQCETSLGYKYWVTASLPEKAEFQLCGDDCSVAYGDPDVLVGWNNADLVYGGAGDDYIVGGSGSDCLWGDNGFDWIFGEDCNASYIERLEGGSGGSEIWGYQYMNANGGTACVREMTGGSGEDTLVGGPGNDTISGSAGNDWLYGNNGTDPCDGGTGTDYCEATPSCNSRPNCEP